MKIEKSDAILGVTIDIAFLFSSSQHWGDELERALSDVLSYLTGLVI